MAVALFSGGLDSLAGAIDLLESGNKTILVSHESQSGTIRTQRALYDALAKKYGNLALACRFKCHLKNSRPPEETQRTRALLYCSIAFAIAEANGANEAYVHENGVTSVNLYRREDQLNSRASRTTHPRTMQLLERVFGLIIEREFSLRLPFIHLTKRAIVDRIRSSPMSSLVSSAVSCTSAFRSEKASHCGECFQCVDRRIACFAAGADDADHAGLYETDIVAFDMTSAETITAAMDYVRLARNCARNGIGWFEREFASELADVVCAMQGDSSEVETVERIRLLMKQHGDNVELGIRRMRDRYDDPYDPHRLPPRCLLSLIASREALKSGADSRSSDGQVSASGGSATNLSSGGFGVRSSSTNKTSNNGLHRGHAMKTSDMNKIKTLFIAANPASTPRLALDEELRDILEKIRATEHRDAFEMVVAPAARPDDVEQALLEHSPVIVHFSGHGSDGGGLVFQGDTGRKTKLFSAEAIGDLFRLLKKNLRVVVLNACYSDEQAKAIVREIDFVVGMKDSIGDLAARRFAASFYRGLGFGQTINTAFGLGVNALKREGLVDDENVPVLLVRSGISADVVLLDPR